MKVWIVTKDVDLGVSIEGVFADRKNALKMFEDGNIKDCKKWVGQDGIQRETSGGWNIDSYEVVKCT